MEKVSDLDIYFKVPRPQILSGQVVEIQKPFLGGGRVVKCDHEDQWPINALGGRVIQERGVEPSPGLARVATVAKGGINKFRVSLGLPPVPEEKMEVVYMEDSVFTDTFGESRGGVTRCLGHQAVVRLQSGWPDYFIGSSIFHELSHCHLEKKTGVYAFDKDNPGSYFMHIENRRSGLDVAKRLGGKGEKQGPYGEENRCGVLLNELPIFYYEVGFVHYLLSLDEFRAEAEKRMRNLQLLLSGSNEERGTHVPFEGVTPDGKKRLFVFSEELLHFYKDGQLLLPDCFSMVCFAQLAGNLASLCGPVDEKSFMMLWLKAKLDPRLLPKLRDVVDGKLGSGFFSRLRRAGYRNGDARELLLETQKLMFPELEE